MVEGGFEHRGPRQRFSRTLEGVGERNKDFISVGKESTVEVLTTKKCLKSRFIRRRREISDGGGVLGEMVEA